MAKDAASGEFETGVKVLGAAEGGVDWALDENNAELITDDIKAAIEDAKAKIISGEIQVAEYYANNSCPVE